MNFTPAPTLISSVVSLFRKRTPQPTFTPAAAPIPTQVYMTRNTTVHVDAPVVSGRGDKGLRRKDRPLSLHVFTDIFEKKMQDDLFPETPRAPNPQHTTFVLPIHQWSSAELVGGRFWDDDRSSAFGADLDVLPEETTGTRVSKEDGVYPAAEPKTLARALFLFGFLFPAFWVIGCIILWTPLRTTKDWEAGRNSVETKWRCSVIRETELRWARRCLLALLLLSEVVIVLLVVVIVKWGVKVQF